MHEILENERNFSWTMVSKVFDKSNFVEAKFVYFKRPPFCSGKILVSYHKKWTWPVQPFWRLSDINQTNSIPGPFCLKCWLVNTVEHGKILWPCKAGFTSYMYIQGVPKKHGNSVTNSISSLLWISIVIPNFKSHNIIMSARVYSMKTDSTDKFTLFVSCNFLVLL